MSHIKVLTVCQKWFHEMKYYMKVYVSSTEISFSPLVLTGSF
jgi:hypothetical protein